MKTRAEVLKALRDVSSEIDHGRATLQLLRNMQKIVFSCSREDDVGDMNRIIGQKLAYRAQLNTELEELR